MAVKKRAAQILCNMFINFFFSGNEYTNIFGSNSFDGSLTPYIHNIFKPDVKICILDGEMLLYHPDTKTFGKTA